MCDSPSLVNACARARLSSMTRPARRTGDASWAVDCRGVCARARRVEPGDRLFISHLAAR
jgi:hypothetical protein